MEEKEPKVKSLYKALKLLDYFDENHKEAGVTELAEYSGMLKSSVHNILQTFELCGYVTQNSETSKYMLGGAAISLFSTYKKTRKIDYRITEYMQKLRREFRTDVYFGAKDQGEAVYLLSEHIIGNYGKYLAKEGARVPLHCTAIGKVLLGFSKIEEKEEFYSQEHTRYTEKTIVSPSELKEELNRILYDGYAVSNEEFREGVWSVAVPVIVGFDKIEYAMGISTNTKLTDYTKKQYVKELQYVCKEIGSLLGD